MDLVIRSFSYERQPRIINFDPRASRPTRRPRPTSTRRSAILGGFTEPSDPNLQGPVHQRVHPRRRAGDCAGQGGRASRGSTANYGRSSRTSSAPTTGPTASATPARDMGTNGSLHVPDHLRLDYSQTFPTPRPVRIYRGLQLDVTKRFSNNWQVIASYIYSTLEGNFDGEYAPFTQDTVADPNISAAYDYYDFFTNGSNLNVITNRGPLSNDRAQPVQGLGHLRDALQAPDRPDGLLPDRHALDPLRVLGRLRPLRVLPDAARRRGPDALDLRGGPPPRAIRSRSGRSTSTCLPTSSTSSTPSARSSSTSGGASRRRTTRRRHRSTPTTDRRSSHAAHDRAVRRAGVVLRRR